MSLQSLPANDVREARTSGTSPEYAVVWVLLILTLAAYVPFAAMTVSGILESAPRTPAEIGPVDAGGLSWGLLEVIGVVVLALGLAYGMFSYYTRDRRLDPLTEAATHEVFEHPRPPGR